MPLLLYPATVKTQNEFDANNIDSEPQIQLPRELAKESRPQSSYNRNTEAARIYPTFLKDNEGGTCLRNPSSRLNPRF